ncbi:MAG: hypothetical protein ACRD1K_05545 [Acidimicrobiales bacterium]
MAKVAADRDVHGGSVAARPGRPVTRCNACLTVLATPPPGRSVSCRCGLVTVWGDAGRPRRHLKVEPGSGWTALPEPGAP